MALYKEHLSDLDCTKYTPRDRISDTQGNLWPVKLVSASQIMLFRGPSRKHHDLLRLMDMRSHINSRSHACSNCSKYTTDGDGSINISAHNYEICCADSKFGSKNGHVLIYKKKFEIQNGEEPPD